MNDLVDIEVGHPYLDDHFSVKKFLDTQERFIKRALKRREYYQDSGSDVQFSLLIDDLDFDFDENFKKSLLCDLRSTLEEIGLFGINIQYESTLYEYAESLTSTIRERFIVNYGGSQFLAITTEDPFLRAGDELVRKRSIKEAFFQKLTGENAAPPPNQSQFLIPLKSSDSHFRKFGCSLLTSVWYLQRLQIVGFYDSNTNLTTATKIENILPQKYLKSEGFAIEILNLSRAARIRKAAKKIEHIIFR